MQRASCTEDTMVQRRYCTEDDAEMVLCRGDDSAGDSCKMT